MTFLTFVVSPKKSFLIRFCLCPFINYVITEIEVFRHINIEIAHEVLIR